jgi:hypothetical protein
MTTLKRGEGPLTTRFAGREAEATGFAVKRLDLMTEDRNSE